MRYVLLLQDLERRQRRESRVPVIGAPASVQPIIPQDGFPWTEIRFPARHLRLLVHVPVKQDRIVDLAGNLHVEQRCAALVLQQ